jgi:hypothetical protein
VSSRTMLVVVERSTWHIARFVVDDAPGEVRDSILKWVQKEGDAIVCVDLVSIHSLLTDGGVMKVRW